MMTVAAPRGRVIREMNGRATMSDEYFELTRTFFYGSECETARRSLRRAAETFQQLQRCGF
jgi:hypothetical protein